MEKKEAARAFQDTERHHDGQEWVDLLIEAIGDDLAPEQKVKFDGHFHLGIEELFKCQADHLQPKRLAPLYTLQLAILDKETGQPLITLDEALASYFADECIEKICNTNGCSAQEVIKESKISLHPNLLKIQYKRFHRTGNKIGHHVSANPVLKLNDIQYELVSLLEHRGEEFSNGHYISITR